MDCQPEAKMFCSIIFFKKFKRNVASSRCYPGLEAFYDAFFLVRSQPGMLSLLKIGQGLVTLKNMATSVLFLGNCSLFATLCILS